MAKQNINFEATERGLRGRKSKVVFYDGKETKDLAETIHKLFIKREQTMAVYNCGTKKRQCCPYRARSIQDLFQIVKEYEPNLKFEKLYDIVDKISDTGYSNKPLRYWFCTTVKRRVHAPTNLILSVNTIRKFLGENNIIFKK